MAGVVLETLSNRKLIGLGVILCLLQLTFFLLGGLIAPAPSNVQQVLGTKCLDEGNHRHKDAWFYPRPLEAGGCEAVSDLDDPIIQQKGITANQVVFSFQIPLPKEYQWLSMSRWFQHLISVLMVDINYDEKVPFSKNAMLTMDARLGYRDNSTPYANWTEIVRSTEERRLQCNATRKEDKWPMQCDLLAFFELGSCHHDYYLINIRLPVHELKEVNLNIGALKDMWLVVIHQNGGFTKVWLAIKTAMFPVVIAILSWFWRRITQLERPQLLLEQTLFTLGLALSLLNLPLEWLTLHFDMPYMLLLSDIRQGIFYGVLLCFWIIFAGEHMMDQVERNRLVLYWRHLSGVIFGCICLFVFEMCERGVQLTNPFYSIWVTETGNNLALAFIILAGLSACCYFIFLCYMIFKVFRNISAKKTALPHMNKARRKYYSGLIFRFKFLMMGTLLCAAMTVIFFIISQVSEGHYKWGENNILEYTSAFFTGVYGMWNLYVICLMVLYAPSHKYMAVLDTDENSGEETVEFSNISSEATSLTNFAKKAAAD